MENREPLISVVVPVYNGQDYLAGCIESIENQTYGNLEIIIVNDGSTDRTAAVCDSLQAACDNVRVLTMDDEGVSAARNAGTKMAQGEYVTYVDADDRLLPGMIRVLYDCMVQTQSDVAGCKFFTWSREEEWRQAAEAAGAVETEKYALCPGAPGADSPEQGTSGEGRQEVQVRTYDAGTYLREELLNGNSRCWSKLYRRAAVENVRFREGLTIGEDMLFLVQLLPHIRTIAETAYAGYGYYQNPAGAINREFTPRYMDQITCWQLAREEIPDRDAGLDAQVTALGIMGIMLTVGKLALLPAGKRRAHKEYIIICRDKLKEAMKIPGAYRRLSVGYKLKTVVFRAFPGLYIRLYHLHKQKV